MSGTGLSIGLHTSSGTGADTGSDISMSPNTGSGMGRRYWLTHRFKNRCKHRFRHWHEPEHRHKITGSDATKRTGSDTGTKTKAGPDTDTGPGTGAETLRNYIHLWQTKAKIIRYVGEKVDGSLTAHPDYSRRRSSSCQL